MVRDSGGISWKQKFASITYDGRILTSVLYQEKFNLERTMQCDLRIVMDLDAFEVTGALILGI